MVQLADYISRAGHRTIYTTKGKLRRFKDGVPPTAPIEAKDGDDDVIWGADNISIELNCPGGVQQVYAMLAASKAAKEKEASDPKSSNTSVA
jgi:hypothetical protein